MPKVGENNEPLHERLVFAYDGTNYRVLVCDTDGYLKVAMPYEEALGARSYGWINAGWQRNPIPFGASASLKRTWYDDTLDAGNPTVVDTAVPAGEYWVITNIIMAVVSASISRVDFRAYIAGGSVEVFNQVSPTSGQYYDRQLWMVLFPGDYMWLQIYGATAGDAAYGKALGFRVDIDQ